MVDMSPISSQFNNIVYILLLLYTSKIKIITLKVFVDTYKISLAILHA